jgi:membrane protein implicated in regulation of membrane protease activity
LAEGQFIPQGTHIQIQQVEGATIFVHPAKPMRKKS